MTNVIRRRNAIEDMMGDNKVRKKMFEEQEKKRKRKPVIKSKQKGSEKAQHEDISNWLKPVKTEKSRSMSENEINLEDREKMKREFEMRKFKGGGKILGKENPKTDPKSLERYLDKS